MQQSRAERLLSPFNRPQWQYLQPILAISLAIFVWSAVGLGPFSGKNTPPLYGDFEAQRHWMEITQHLPCKLWYYYDLQWWGLDYPPLTAYHSWLIGKIGSLYNQTWFALDTSRGNEMPQLVAFMRKSVIFSELAIYVPAILLYCNRVSTIFNVPFCRSSAILGALLLMPCLTLIDNGHFQFNSVMLGFFVLTLDNLEQNHFVVASIWFVLALFFKQMALYYAPVVFFYILGYCVQPLNMPRLLSVGMTVIVTSTVLLLPFINQLDQVVFRVFPFARGLWEDKVANVWCTANTIIKLKVMFSTAQLQKLALSATLAGIAPACVLAFTNPAHPGTPQRPGVLVWATSACAWAFFLFSFQVHEKTVLVPLVPTSLLLLHNDPNITGMVMWINNIAYYSLWPLLNRDGLSWQYWIVGLFWNWLFGQLAPLPTNILNRFAVVASYTAIACVSLAEKLDMFSTLLAKYPDLWVVANISLSCGCFIYFYLWLHMNLFTRN